MEHTTLVATSSTLHVRCGRAIKISSLILALLNAYIFGNTDCPCAFVKAQERIYNLNRGVESMSKEDHGLFFDAVMMRGLSNEVKQAAVALYLDFNSRPIGEYNAE